jgi:lathosterol oxidase
MIDILLNPYYFWTILTISNILMFISTLIISTYFNTKNNNKISKNDIKTSIFILILNILVAVPGYWLWSNGYINFNNNYLYIVSDLLLLFIFLDIIMYIFHLLAHYLKPFVTYHKKHHTHVNLNSLSLYVMHPVESVGLGLIITTLCLLFNLNIYSLLIYLFANWLWGTIAHLSLEIRKNSYILGNSTFHAIHHEKFNCNYGFYTTIWDKIFKTYKE